MAIIVAILLLGGSEKKLDTQPQFRSRRKPQIPILRDLTDMTPISGVT